MFLLRLPHCPVCSRSDASNGYLPSTPERKLHLQYAEDLSHTVLQRVVRFMSRDMKS
jgi:hypothetical protein